MKYSKWLFTVIFAYLLSAASVNVEAQGSGIGFGLNRIEGRVVNMQNVGVDNAYVELYNNNNAMVDRVRSSGQGRFSFRNMGPGRYTIIVKPYGTTLREESVETEIVNQSMRSDTVYVTINLREYKITPSTPDIVGTVFAQEVPEEAKRLYKSGVERMSKKPDAAIADLESAVKAFPDYFDALAALGKAQVVMGKNESGVPNLLRAININRKCSDCYYSLALALHKLNVLDDAKKAIEAAVVLQSNEPSIRLLQGMILFRSKEYAEAEKALLSAEKNYKNPNPEVYYQLSLVYNKLGRNSESADQLEKFIKAKPDLKESEKKSLKETIAKLRSAKK